MKILVCFLIILHITRGQKYDAYDANNCGKSQLNVARSSMGRIRRSASQLDNDDEAGNDFMQQKIMGGRRAERGELPWAVLIHIWKNRYTRGNCGGTLISRRHVLTAAHCFVASESKGRCSTSNMYSPDFVKANTKVFIGGTCSSAGKFGCTESDIGRVYKVARSFHEDYFKFGCKGTHDIAILELSEDVPKTINHVCLPFMHNLKEIEDPYLKLKTFGWGRDRVSCYAKAEILALFPAINLSTFGGLSPYLQVAELGAKLPEKECSRRKAYKAKDTFCLESGKKEFCRGDSGGGATATIRGRSYLMGIAVMGPPCDVVAKAKAQSFPPQICTDIMYYKDLIKKWIGAKISRRNEVPNPSKRKPRS